MPSEIGYPPYVTITATAGDYKKYASPPKNVTHDKGRLAELEAEVKALKAEIEKSRSDESQSRTNVMKNALACWPGTQSFISPMGWWPTVAKKE